MADLTQVPASVLKSSGGRISAGTAGATIVAGNTLYLDPATRSLKLADSNGTPPANSITGMALNGGGAGQPINYVTQDPSLNIGVSVTAGAVVYLSDTPGAATATYSDIASDSTVIVLGVGNTDGTVNYSPLVGGTK